jgi:PKD repeat protein
MKTKNIFIIIAAFISLNFNSCINDDFNVPTASTQSKFSFTYEIIAQGDSSVYQVHFTNESINAKSYLWDFGNGQTSTEENPTVIFGNEGEYNIKLTVTSDNELYYNKLEYTKNLNVIFKVSNFKETFDNEEYLNTFPPTNWLMIDNDGDGNNWYFDYYDGDGYILSRSWQDPNPLTPDNWLITPSIDLTAVTTGQKVYLSYTVCPTANTAIYRTEHYSIMVSEGGTTTSDFSQIFEETLTTDMTNWVFAPRLIDISEYAGKNIRISIRHNNSTDKDRIAFGEIEVYTKL